MNITFHDFRRRVTELNNYIGRSHWLDRRYWEEIDEELMKKLDEKISANTRREKEQSAMSDQEWDAMIGTVKADR